MTLAPSQVQVRGSYYTDTRAAQQTSQRADNVVSQC